MPKEFLIRMITFKDNEEKLIKAFHSNQITEYLKLYTFAKENDITIEIPEDDNDTFYSEYNGHMAFIESININFGGNESIPTLNIYVGVI